MKLRIFLFSGLGRLPICTTVVLLASTLGWTDVAAQTNAKAIVAVYDIHNLGTPLSPNVVKRLGDYLAGRLAMCPRFAVAPRDQLREQLAGQRTESRRDCYDQSCQIEFGKLLSADKSLATSLIKLGRVCVVTSSLYDVRTETTDGAADEEGLCTEDGIRQSLKTVISMLCQGIGGNVQQNHAPAAKEAMLPPPPAVTPGVSQPEAVEELPPVRKEVGYLSVQGEPKGARVDISGPTSFGKGDGLSTSLPMRPIEVPPGDYVVKVSQTEYEVKTVNVHVSADETTPVQINLDKSFGRLILSGNPEGARTSLHCANNFEKEFGLPSQPFEIKVPRGDCRILVSRDGYESFDKSYRLNGGQDFTVVVKLTKHAAVPQKVDGHNNSKTVSLMTEKAARAPFRDRPRAIVFDTILVNIKPNLNMIKRLTAYFESKLVSDGVYEAIDQKSIKGSFENAKREAASAVCDDACKIELGTIVSANQTINSKVVRHGKKCFISANAYDIKMGTMVDIATVAEVDCSEESLIRGLQEIAVKLSSSYVEPSNLKSTTSPKHSVLAVANLDPGDSKLDDGLLEILTDTLLTQLMKSSKYMLIPPSVLSSRVHSSRNTNPVNHNDDDLIKIGKNVAADKIMKVVIRKMGKGCWSFGAIADLRTSKWEMTERFISSDCSLQSLIQSMRNIASQ